MSNCSFKNRIVTIALLLLTFSVNSQIITNKSFEGSRGEGRIPSGWNACHQFSSPDTQPGFWNVSTPPSDGNSYAGIVTRGNLGPFANNNEDIATRLLRTISPGESFDFNIDLAISHNWGHSIPSGTFLRYDTPAKLQVYGSSFSCGRTELMWESPLIDHTDWKTYSFSITPETTEISHLILQAIHPGSTTNFGNILIDNIEECFILLEENTPVDTVICEGALLNLDVTIPDGEYLWQDGNDSPLYTIEDVGIYSVTISNNCVEETFEFNVSTRNCICDTAIPISTMAYDTTICEGEFIILDASTRGGQYQWADGNMNSTRSVSIAGTYAVEVTNGCDTEEFEFNVTTRNCVCDTAVPIAVTGYDSLICEGGEIILDASTPGGMFSWDNGDESPQRQISEPGTYSVSVSNGCDTEIIDFTISEKECFCELTYPNVFTPNGDNKNESFDITASSEVEIFNLQIYQRTGQLVFQSDDTDVSWNGDSGSVPLPSGVYFWQAQITCKINDLSIEKNIKGTVTLIR